MSWSLVMGPVAALMLGGAALAQSLPVYEGPVPVTLGDNRFDLPIAVAARATEEGRLHIDLRAQLEAALPVAAQALRREIEAVPTSCTDRLAVRAVSVSAEEGLIVARVRFRYARWVCERVFGARVESELFSETATIEARVEPFAEDGQLQLRLAGFQIDELGELAQALNAEGWLRQMLRRGLGLLNADPAFARPPAPIWDEGYRYDSVTLDTAAAPLLVVGITGPDSALALLRIKVALEAQ